jgi:SAM-dependent methyltransferase
MRDATRPGPGKTYDRAYFDRWYRSRAGVVTAGATRRRARFALAAAEYVLNREVRSVLDVGCGEGVWRGELRRVRPRLRWVGVDSSEYVARRFGRRRGIRRATFGDLGDLRLRGRFDLVVCSDVIQYVPTRELRRGLRAIHGLLGGVAFLAAWAAEDDIEGDREGWVWRTADQLRAELRRAGLLACGLHCWVRREDEALLGALERAE